MEELDQAAVDSAIILENKIRERIREELKYILDATVREQVNKMFREQKGSLVMEVTASINQMLRSFIEQERKPLWESTPEEFGLTHEELNRSSMRRLDDIQQEINNAIHKDT
jgi:hypothetical protein